MTDKNLDINGVTRFRHIEIEICSHCDANCFSCDRFVDVAPAPQMTLEQVNRFVENSLAMDWEWDRIHLLGGEPTLHSQLREIAASVLRLREKRPDTLVRVISNGAGRLADHLEWLQLQGIHVAVESKIKGVLPRWFDNMRMAPVDKHPDKVPLDPCAIFGVKGCGIGLTRHGYFLCGAGASIARMLGEDIGVMRLEDLTYAAMLEQATILCHVCGHWGGPTDTLADTGVASGPFWTQAISRYKEAPPTLSVFGS